MNPPLVTVIIPTHRRPDGLRRCLEALADQQAPFDWDVIVVDNDPAPGRDATRVVERIRDERPELRIVLITETRPGAARARNTAIDHATGEIVAMLDDDVVPQPAWLVNLVKPVIAGDAGGSGGLVVLEASAKRPAWFDERAVGGYFTSHDLGGTQRPVDYFAELAVSANAAFRTDVLRAIGGFDETFGPRGHQHIVCDDARLTRAVIASGETVMWTPDAVVEHELPASRLRLAWLLRRAWWQGRSDWRLERLELRHRRVHGVWAGVVQVGSWTRQELSARISEGLTHPTVAVHAACDLVRMAGRITEITADWARGLLPGLRA